MSCHDAWPCRGASRLTVVMEFAKPACHEFVTRWCDDLPIKSTAR
jgi:hypothetical protein